MPVHKHQGSRNKDSSGSEAARALEGDGDSIIGCEGVDGAEQGASMAAREAEGDDEDEAMVGDENISMQMAGGGGCVTAGIKKKKPRRRAKGAGNHSQRKDAARRDRSEHARHETSALPLGV